MPFPATSNQNSFDLERKINYDLPFSNWSKKVENVYPVNKRRLYIAPNFDPKCDSALIWRVFVTKQLSTLKRENSLLEEIIVLQFGENCTSLPLPIPEEAWRARFTSFISLSLYCRSPDGAVTERTQLCCGGCRSTSQLVNGDFHAAAVMMLCEALRQRVFCL